MQTIIERRKGLYLTVLTPQKCRGYILYVHGGPGGHSAYFEAAVSELSAYKDGPFGWICYDQRSCGRSEKSAQGPSHEENISDLADLIRYLQTDEKYPILGILGHSYGGWLTFHTLSENKDLTLPLIIVACAKDMRTAKNHSFAIDMLELRIDQPDVYKNLLPELDNFDGPLWEFQKRIRKEAAPLKRRPLFMWGNLAALNWYNGIKQKVGMPESWELTHEISSKIGPEYMLKRLDPAALKTKMLRIMGVHDFLMDGDQYYPGAKTEFTTFLKSGHYPHFEEPEKFVKALTAFLFDT
jgi:pimeloyl-ACP methyl ester carboxylesterase